MHWVRRELAAELFGSQLYRRVSEERLEEIRNTGVTHSSRDTQCTEHEPVLEYILNHIRIKGVDKKINLR